MLATQAVAAPLAPRARRCRRAAAVSRCVAAAHADAPQLAALLESAGASTTLVVGDGPLGRGLFATAPAREGDVLLSVPLRHALVVTTSGSKAFIETHVKQWRLAGLALPPALAVFVQDVRVLPAPRLAAWLLWARTAAPVWQHVDALLPPRGFTVAAATEAAAEAHAAYSAAVKADATLARSAEEFEWALACVASRTFGADAWTRSERDGVLGVMMPAADLLNHRFDPNCQFRLRADAGLFEVVARRNVKPGEEACISYGEELCNDELTQRYGFSAGASNPNGDVKQAPKRRINW